LQTHTEGSALVRLGLHPLALGPAAASRSLARLGSSNFRALIAEKRAKEFVQTNPPLA
jgi:hypothetical protein